MAIKSTFAAWNYESNITEATKEPYLKLQKDSSKLTKQHGKEAQNFDISVIEVTVWKHELVSEETLLSRIMMWRGNLSS